jgi:RNA polymerase sigma-70 factor (ECF subfamily)
MRALCGLGTRRENISAHRTLVVTNLMTGSSTVSDRSVDRLFARAGAERWKVDRRAFAAALEASVAKAFARQNPSDSEIDRYLNALHLEDLALACACAAGTAPAWDHFIKEHRPVLYRSADAIDPTGGARELADSLYADLYGIAERGGQRSSLFRYFHGRSSLATWLRSVLAQRHVDRVRASRKLEQLPDDDAELGAVSPQTGDPDRVRLTKLVQQAFVNALSHLAARDRLRLACYYAQGLTLAQTGRLLREHEATASRQLARTRRGIRDEVERQLREQSGLSDGQIAQAFEWATGDSGTLDLQELLAVPGNARKTDSGVQ